MRFFFAAWPPPQTARALADWAQPLGGRPTPAEKIHLTLAFLGVVEPDKALAAARRVQGERHDLPIETAQYWKHNRVLWAGPRQTPAALQALVERLQFELYRAEYILERRPFAAHVTLARMPRPPARFPRLPEVEWPVREFTLVRSTLSATGSTYDVVERFPVG